MLRLLLGTDWKVLRKTILEELKADVDKELEGRVLLVPELISHEMERSLCAYAGDRASRFAEVLSFTRLCRSVAESVGCAGQACLDGGGRVVAMAASTRQLASRLKAYAAVESKPEFLKELVDAVDEFKRCCITPEDLKQASQASSGSFAQKLEELSAVMEAYDGLCAQGKRDPRDQMTWLLERLEDCDYGAQHVFYIDGFPDFTRQNMAILEHLICTSPMVTVALNCDVQDSKRLAFEKPGQTAGALLRMAKRRGVPVRVQTLEDTGSTLSQVGMRLFQGGIPRGFAWDVLKTVRADGIWQEVLAAAQQAEELVRRGIRYRDITLVVTDLAAYAGPVGLIFRRMGIPLYQAGTEDILQKSVIATVLSAVEACWDLEPKAMQKYLRSALSPLTPDECDRVENYAYLWSIRGKQWLSPWEKHPQGLQKELEGKERTQEDQALLKKLNDLRARVAEPLERLRRGMENGKNLSAQVLALYRFLEEIQMAPRLQALAEDMDGRGENREAQILNQLWEILVSALEQMYDVLGGTHWEPEPFLRLLRLLLSQYDVGTIPPVLDAVQMGTVSALRCHEGRYLLLLGAKEGALPNYSGAKGVLTDQEREALRKLGVPLTGGALEGIQEEFAEIYGVFSGARDGIWVFCGDEQPSYLFKRLEEMAGTSSIAEDGLEFAGANPREAGTWLARWDQDLAAQSLGAAESFFDTVERRGHSLGFVRRESLEGLYGKTLRLSASQVDTQGECRLLYFLKYGLKAKERKPAQMDPAEFGTFVHSVLEDTVRQVNALGGFQQVSLEKTQEIAGELSRQYRQERLRVLDSQRVKRILERNQQELQLIVEELWQELHNGAFLPVGVEVAFGPEGELPWISIPNDSMPAVLQGKIDRVDLWKGPGSPYFRVVDYKTGRKSFDLTDVTQGVGMQMLIYLFALEQGGTDFFESKSFSAGVEYFPARVPYVSLKSASDEKTLREKRQEQWQRSGLILSDQDVREAMEPENGQRKVMAKMYQADRQQMNHLRAFVFERLKQCVEDVASGCVEPNPYIRRNIFDPCQYCPYKALCQAEDKRDFKGISQQEFWETVEKEEDHG